MHVLCALHGVDALDLPELRRRAGAPPAPQAARGVIAAAVLALAVAATPNATARADPASPAFLTLQRYDAAQARAAAELGPGVAADFRQRLFDDLYRQRTDVPDGYAAADWSDTVERIQHVDAEAVAQLAAGVPEPLRVQPGLHEYFVQSRTDHTWQAVAVYVPAALRAGARVPLAVALHGNPQTEAELLGQPYFRRLADRTGTIVVAPYGRGIYDFAEPAESDLYDLLDAVQKALPVDRHRTYLVGYSMGGFSVFKIGPRGGYRWTAAMCISGAILNSGTRAVSTAWHDLPLYIVTGAHDESIPTAYGEQTARFLAALGLPVSFYEEARGSHWLRTLVPSLERAWLDMHAGTEHPESIPRGGGGGLPRSAPPPVSKP